MGSLLLRGGTYLLASSAPGSPLRGGDLSQCPVLENGFLLAENGVIVSTGPLAECPESADEIVDCTGRLILPNWCDSHTHIVFAKTREEEFVQRIKGLTYEEIASAGGGILNSALRLRETSEQALFDTAAHRVHQVISMGTGALEIKSGYGLSVESELKMLRVIRRLKETFPIPIKSTFLGAHAIPREYRTDREQYIRLIIGEMLPQIHGEGLADYIDVFCDRGFFDIAESKRILEAGARYGLKPKIHVSELADIGGVQMGIRQGAVSVDHLEVATAQDVQDLAASPVIATLLPGCAFFINLQYAPARALIDAGATVALATDYNPGTAPSGNMSLIVSLACIKMGMLPEEAIQAATLNGAFAMECADVAGSLSPGKLANVIITEPAVSVAYLPYAFGTSHVWRVYIRGMQW